MKTELMNQIVNDYGTPLYLYDGDFIVSQYQSLKRVFPENFEIFYSIKTNPLLGICQLFEQLGSGCEVASSGELYIALNAGFTADKIIFSGPGKTEEELEYAIDNKIYTINCESLKEAQLIHKIAAVKSKQINISLRINPSFDVSNARVKMTGVPTQFGIDQSQVSEVLKTLKTLPNINVMGFQVYSGTQILDANSIVSNAQEIIKMALEFQEQHNLKLQFLDLGGGFGIPYFPEEKPLHLDELQQGISRVWEKYREHLLGTRIIIESGRFLTTESGLYLTKVLYKKSCKGNNYLICDGGSHHHANSAFLGRFVRNNFPMYVLGKTDDLEETNIAGPLCTPTDILSQKVLLPKAEPGDVIVIEKSGSYGLTNSPSLFLSHFMPAELFYYQGEVKVIRERGEKEDFLAKQKSLFKSLSYEERS